MSKQSNPNQNSTPGSSSENAQLQWVLSAISDLKESSLTIQTKLDSHIDSINKKIDSNHASVSEKITEKHKIIEDKLDLKNQILELKIESNHSMVCEKITGIEPTIFNTMYKEQRASNRWVIRLLVTVIGIGIGLIGLLIKIFLMK
ncbi:hypothetical protein V6478_003014 [Providencia rettgeri]